MHMYTAHLVWDTNRKFHWQTQHRQKTDTHTTLTGDSHIIDRGTYAHAHTHTPMVRNCGSWHTYRHISWYRDTILEHNKKRTHTHRQTQRHMHTGTGIFIERHTVINRHTHTRAHMCRYSTRYTDTHTDLPHLQRCEGNIEAYSDTLQCGGTCSEMHF